MEKNTYFKIVYVLYERNNDASIDFILQHDDDNNVRNVNRKKEPKKGKIDNSSLAGAKKPSAIHIKSLHRPVLFSLSLAISSFSITARARLNNAAWKLFHIYLP